MPVSPASEWSGIVTLMTVLFYIFTANRVGRLRAKYDIKAPATAGHPDFDCAFRVHYNTMEQMMFFLPLLWLATYFFRGWSWLPAACGLLFLLGRVMFMQAYMRDPATRLPGIAVGMLGSVLLLVLSVIGFVQNWR